MTTRIIITVICRHNVTIRSDSHIISLLGVNICHLKKGIMNLIKQNEV